MFVAIDTINRRSTLSQNLDDALRRGGFRRMPEPAEIGRPWLMTSGDTLVRLFAATDPSRFASKSIEGGSWWHIDPDWPRLFWSR